MPDSTRPLDPGSTGFEPEPIDRVDSGLRVLYSLLYVIVLSLIESALFVLVGFQIVYAFVTERRPPFGVTDLANRIVGYNYRILRYLTYNDGQRPFPFEEFPQPIEPTAGRSDDELDALWERGQGGDRDELRREGTTG